MLEMNSCFCIPGSLHTMTFVIISQLTMSEVNDICIKTSQGEVCLEFKLHLIKVTQDNLEASIIII